MNPCFLAYIRPLSGDFKNKVNSRKPAGWVRQPARELEDSHRCLRLLHFSCRRLTTRERCPTRERRCSTVSRIGEHNSFVVMYLKPEKGKGVNSWHD